MQVLEREYYDDIVIVRHSILLYYDTELKLSTYV